MFFNVSLTIALIICVAGIIQRVLRWHQAELGSGPEMALGERIAASADGFFRGFFSHRMGAILGALVMDVLLQRRIYQVDKRRWLAHMLIDWGFTLLLVMHALDKFITLPLFPDYAATANPFLFLRNLFGLMVMVGVCLAMYRRFFEPKIKLTTTRMDVYAIALMVVIMLSGFILEGMKFISESKFDEMIEMYYDGDDEELPGVKKIWAEKYGVVFAEAIGEVDEEVMEAGLEQHETACLPCHAAPQSAFISQFFADLFRPAAIGISEDRTYDLFWYIHWLACFIALAYLPFSKMFHLITSPLVMMIRAGTEQDGVTEAVKPTKQALEMEACTHCGTCTEHCSVGQYYARHPNLTILPSEKLAAAKELALQGGLYTSQLKTLQEGAAICTRCYRCTTLCPVGIDLQEMWASLDKGLAGEGFPALTESIARAADAAAEESRAAEAIIPGGNGKSGLGLSTETSSFAHCYSCQTCTNSCPVVASFDDPKAELDLLPHQIMQLLGLGHQTEPQGSGMVWNCLTCYHCQEACPQGVKVADVLYELRNMSARAAGMSGGES